MTNKKDWALQWATEGFHVFPVEPNGKSPLIQDWPSQATDDLAVVDRWWDQWPDANIGAHPGASGHIVIDVDMKGNDGRAALAEVEAEVGALPETFTTRTPSGGLHYWYRYEGVAPNSVSRLAQGVDTRGRRGYAMMPGSSIDEKQYETIRDGGAYLPKAWQLQIGALSTREERVAPDRVDLDHPNSLALARKYLEDLVERDDVAVEGAGGNDRTYRLAAELRDMGLSHAPSVALIDEIWNPHCSPPWAYGELEHVTGNAFHYAQNEHGAKASAPPDGSAFASINTETNGAGTSTKKKTSRFALLDIDGMATLPEPRWLVPGWVPLYTTTLLYGRRESMKSFAALDVGLSIAAGLPAWGLDYEPEQMPVVYVAGEGQIGIGKQRVPAWMEHHGVSELPFYLIRSTPRSTDLNRDLADMFEEIEKHCKPRLIIYDTHARVMTGADENSAQDTSKALELYDATAARYSCSVLSIHHSGKSGDVERGSTALAAGVDTVLRMDYDRESALALLSCEKQKDAEHPKKIGFGPEKVANSIVLTRRELKASPTPNVRAPSGLFMEVVEILKRHDASNAGRALTVAVVASELERVTEIEDTGERKSAQAAASQTIKRGRTKELAALFNDDGRLQLPAASGNDVAD